MKNISFLPNERWVTIILPEYYGQRRYAISNHGRVVSYTNTIETGRLLLKNTKPGVVAKLKIVSNNTTYRLAVNQMVAKHFLPKPDANCSYVLHLDRNSSNNHYQNLMYANYATYRKYLAKKDTTKTEEFRLHANEIWQTIDVGLTQRKYAITNYGRLISYSKSPIEDGVILKGSMHVDGYKIWKYNVAGKSMHKLYHRLVAEYFLQKPNEGDIFVIHLDHNKINNNASNLKWVNKQLLKAHSNLSSAVQKQQENFKNRSKINGRGNKLTVGKVLLLKKILNNPQRTTRKKILAKQFGISSMQLSRIEKGENWGWATQL